MQKAKAVQPADPRADEARPATITMIAVGAGGLGLLIMLGLARVLPGGVSQVHEVFPQADPQPLAAAASETSVHAATVPPSELTRARPEEPAAPARAAGIASAGVIPSGKLPDGPDEPNLPSPDPSRSVAPAPSSGPAAAAVAAGEPAPAPLPARASDERPARKVAPAELAPRTRAASTPRSKPVFEPGVVAYVRCEGSEQRAARFPCPRDRKLEEFVWRTLEQLATCKDADLGRGSAELRLTLHKTRTESVAFRSSTTGPSLDLRAVSKCAGARLANARTSLPVPHAVVSFRFALK